MTRRKRKIGFLKTLLTTTALFACPTVQADEISIDIDSSGKTATLTTGGTLAQDHTEELKNVILLDVAPTENVKIDNGVLAVSKTLNINSGTFGIASTRYDKATFEAVNGTLNINGGNFNSSAHVNFTLAGKTVNVLNNAVFSSSVSESGSSHPIYRIKGDNISFVGTAKSGRLQLYFIPYKDGGKWNISAPIEEYSVIFGEEESSGYVNPASMVEVSETIAATGMFKESPGSVKVNRGITVHFSKDVSSAHFFQNRGVVRLDGTLTTGFYGGFEDSALYGTGSIVMNVPDDGKSRYRALHNIGYNPTTGKTERFKSIVVKSKKNNSYGNHDITGQSSIETVTVIDSGINLMGRGSLIDIGTLTVNGYYDYSLSFGLFQVTNGAIANIGMLTVNETEAWVKNDSTLIVDKYKLPPKGSSTDGSFGAFLLQDGATFLRRNGGVLELDDFYQNGNVNIGGASTTTPATFGAGDWSKVYATGYVDLKGDGQNASKFYGIKGLSSDVASLVNAETGLNFIISSGAVEVKNIYGETGGKGVVKSGATLTADSVSLSNDTSKIIAPTIQIDQDGRLNLQSSIEAFGGKNYVVFKGKGTLSVPKNIAEKLTETALYAFLDNLGTLEIDTSTGDNTVVLYDNRDNQDISSSIDKLVFKGDNAGTLQLCDKLIVRGADFGTNGKVHLITGSTLYFDVKEGTLPANIIGTGTLGLLNSSKLELSDAAVGNLALEGLEIDGKAEAVIKADISIDKLKFMQDTGGTLGIDRGKTLTVKSGVTMGTGNKIDGANGALIVQGDSSFSNTVLGTLTAQKATFKGGNSTIGTYNAQGDVVVEAGTTLAVVNAFDLSGGYHVSGDGSLTVGAGGKIATGDKVLANLTINGETTFYDDSTIGTLKVNGVTAKVATGKTLTISKSFSGAINAGEATLRLIDSAQADFKAGDSTKMARFVMEGADARAAFYGNYSLNEMELKQGTIVLADGAVLSLSHGILSGGNITGGGTLNLTAQNTEITKTGNYALSHLTFGNGGALTLNGTLTMRNDTNVKDSLSGSGTLNFGANGTVGGGNFDGTISVGQNQVTVESDMTLGTFKFTQSAGGTLWIDDNVTLTVGKLQGVGSNTVRGGILKLLSGGEIGNVNIAGELSLGGDTTITGDSVIDTVTATGDVIIADGVTLTVNKKLDLSPNNNIVYGAQNTGTLVLNGSDNKIATKTKILGTLRIGESGAVTFYDDAVIGTLDSRGTTTVAAGKTLTIRQSYGGKLSASGATLKLTETAQGTFAADDGSVIGRLEIAGDGAKATFNGAYALNDLTLSKGQVEINDVLTLTQGAFTGGTVSGTGSLKLAGTLTIGAGAGVSISNLTFDTNGKLNLNGQLTVNNELDYRGHLVDAGNGTLTLGAKGTFGGTFNGTVRVGQTTAEIAADSVFKAFEFTATGGALTIADGATLTIAQLNAAGNSVSGGNLKLTGGAVFDTASLNDLTAGADVVVNKSLTVNGALSAASVSGVGELTLTNGGSLTTGGKVLGTLSGGQATITGDSTVGALNADVIINAGKTLTITKSVKDGLAASGDGLLLLDGASADFGSAAIKNLKLNNASVDWSGVLKVDSLQSGDAPSTLTGGTLALAGNAAFNGKMDVDALKVNAGTFTFNGTTGDVENMTLADGAKLVIATGELNAYGFTGTNNTVTIAEDAAFGLDLGSSQALPTGLTITGAGYLSLLNETSLTFAGNAGEFGELGGLQVMRGTVTITADTNVKNFRFGDKTGGTLNIENGTFSVSKITTRSDNNKIIGKGTLKLTAGESVFDSALDGETKIVVGGKALALFNGKTVLPALTVENGGGVGAGENGDVSIAELSMKNGKIFGSGVLKADKLTMDGGTVKVSGGLAAKTIENGTLEVEKKGVLSLENSVLNSAGITMTGGLLNLKTDYALSALNLTLNGGTVSFGTLTVDAAFVNAGGKLSGTKLIWAHDGELTAQADVDTLQINAGLVLTNDTTVNTLDFGGSGALTLSGGLTVNGSLNLTRDITGNGTLIAAGDAVLGANFGGTLQIGTDAKAGTATVVSDAAFGGLTFGGKGGAVEINAGKRLSVPTVSVASGGTVAGDGTLALTGTGSVLGANLSVAEIELSGQATAQTASVNGLTLKDGGCVDVENGLSVAKLKQTGTDGVINGGTLTVQSAAVENSLTLNNAAATIGSLSGAGVLRLNGSDTVLSQANIGTLAVSGGTLNIGKNQITANDFTMENGTLKLQIGKNATDGNGNATGVGHGKITGGTTVSNSALSIEVEYNTYIPKNGVVFKLFDGSQNGAFAEVANEKYKITAESNGNYRIAKLHTSAENAGNAGGNKNQQNTAEGLLDHPPFDEGDKTYDLADELNRLEQSDKQSFLDGLTAAAPDVSGAVSAAHLRSQRVINSMTVKRLTALHDKLGRSSYGFRRDQKLMRGMRRGRSGGSRYYDARKYYQKAYGRGAARSSVRSKPYKNYWSNGLAEYQNWRTPTASVWAETLLNKTTYKDDGKPDGFSGTSTGFTVGLDAVRWI